MPGEHANPISFGWFVVFTVAITIIWLTSPFFPHRYDLPSGAYFLGWPAGLAAIVTVPNAWRWLYNEVRAMFLS